MGDGEKWLAVENLLLMEVLMSLLALSLVLDISTFCILSVS